jgi:hypothetical protein
MAKCKLIEDKDYTGDGQTFYSNDGCLRPTGVFVPRIESLTYTPDVILWLHGWYVSGAKNGLEPAKGYETKLRDSVLASKKNVILIFPWLGKQTYRGEGTLGLHNLGGGSNLQQYLDTVLASLTDWLVEHLIAGEIEQSGRPPNYKVGNLVIGCHSGGGDLMRAATATLGTYSENLKECWGFDCMYADGTTYERWARPLATRGVKLYFYLANGSSATHFAEFWKASFGTPRSPRPGGMPNLYLAPAAPGVEVDSTAFQTMDQIQSKPDSPNPFDTVRRKVDLLLNKPDEYARFLKGTKLQDHFEVVQSMFGRRLIGSGLG